MSFFPSRLLLLSTEILSCLKIFKALLILIALALLPMDARSFALQAQTTVQKNSAKTIGAVGSKQTRRLAEPTGSENTQSLGYRDAMQACYRLFGNGSLGTAILLRDENHTGDAERILLVTAGHVLNRISGDQATLSLRKKKAQPEKRGEGWERVNQKFRIRSSGKPLWFEHPEEDVAVMLLPAQFLKELSFPVQTLPLSTLARKKDWINTAIESGDLVRCIGYPHAAQLDTSPAGFPLIRVGALSNFPLVNSARVLIDYNIFEGDSGGAVVYKTLTPEGESRIYLLGIIQGQHFIDERYKLIYQSGLIRKRIGLAISINSQLVHEAIDLLYESATKKQDPKNQASPKS